MTVELQIDDRVARVTINRPERLNAVDAKTERELDIIWQDLESRRDISCIVLTGAGDRAFSAGADMKEDGPNGVAYWTQGRPNGFGGISLRRSLDIPLVARVNGFAMGGGFEMVLGCDIVIASETARFALPEATVGRLPLDGGMVLLQRKIPYNIALGLMLTGRQASAAEMAAYGIVNEVVAPGALDDAVERWVRSITACAPLSLRAIKQVTQRTAHLSPPEAQALRLPAVIEALESEDATEGVRAFREKRAPVWRGC